MGRRALPRLVQDSRTCPKPQPSAAANNMVMSVAVWPLRLLARLRCVQGTGQIPGAEKLPNSGVPGSTLEQEAGRRKALVLPPITGKDQLDWGEEVSI